MSKQYYVYRNKKVIGAFTEVPSLESLTEFFDEHEKNIPDSGIDINPVPLKDEIVIIERKSNG